MRRVLHLISLVLAVATASALPWGQTPATAGTTKPLQWHGFLSEPLRAVGKLYMTGTDGVKSVCSGTLVGRSLVLTAAHCLYTNPEMTRGGLGPTGYQTRVEFVPMHGYDSDDRRRDVRAHGTWVASRFWVTRPFMRNDRAYDYGLVELGPDAQGRLAGDVVGAYTVSYGIAWRQGLRVLSVGYPANGYFGNSPDASYGNGQYACDARYVALSRRSGSGISRGIACTMTGGSSGGPWLTTLADGTRTVIGINSRGNNANASGQIVGDAMWTPTLDRRFAAFWRAVERQLAHG